MFHHYWLELRFEFTPGEGYRAVSYQAFGCDDPFESPELLAMGTIGGRDTFPSALAAHGDVVPAIDEVVAGLLARWGHQDSLF